ncbi:uncharacterized protein LOC130642240 [Hydractinia symbiolongicarpus]|uniref:uncharacterized protein LOC130642240 n=1 Tax=Hydractinia symbiolongicarpus TaxID=13093 RepID=UPI00254F11BC|nr:uncharacterized protein LOC130642240 [Hydractinia symbiolongicarpus]
MEGTKRCPNCKKVLAPDEFRVLKNGQTTTNCICCLDKKKQQCTKNKCPHGRRREQCKEGSQIYPHEKQRAYCKECGGVRFASMKRIRSQCKECKGSQICQHEKRRSQCKECKRSQIYPHEKLKYRCKECKGSQICIKHGRRRSTCRDCEGGSICIEHGRIRSECKDCGGGGICEHKNKGRIAPFATLPAILLVLLAAESTIPYKETRSLVLRISQLRYGYVAEP